MSHSTGDNNIDSDSVLECFISLGNFCKLTTSIGFIAAHSYKNPHHCPAKMMVKLVNHKKNQLPVQCIINCAVVQ